MKKLLLIALALFTLNATAQQQKQEKRQEERKERKEKSKRMQRFADFTPEEMAQLKTKKMTLDLDLTEAQQKDLYKFNLKEAQERKQMMEERKKAKEQGEKGNKPSKDERFKMANNKLDRQIAHKKEMKRILNDSQFEKWERMSKKMQQKNKQKRKVLNHKKDRK
ncbi:MAG: hypothetical protein KJN82_06350 [Bacteroidia bacterium]|nr:hypothetical protein [Bacteroidia bacterium]